MTVSTLKKQNMRNCNKKDAITEKISLQFLFRMAAEEKRRSYESIIY